MTIRLSPPHWVRPLHLAPADVALYKAYEVANRRAAEEYPVIVRRAAYSGCAGGCGTVVNSEGRYCVSCRESR